MLPKLFVLAVKCPQIKCKACSNGYKIDKDGCQTCDCCSGVFCMMFCKDGFMKGKDGCPMCRCNEPGPIGPPSPPSSCAAVTCPEGSICKVAPQSKCYPHTECKMVASCVKKPYNCKQLECGKGERCIEDNIQCVKEPCDKNPRCECNIVALNVNH